MVSRPLPFQGSRRRQALPVTGVAADLDSCGRGIAPLSLPPHPPVDRAPLTLGSTLRSGRGRHSFWQCRWVGASALTRGLAPPKHRNPRGTKAQPCFEPVDFPRVASVFPWVGVFLPHVHFWPRGLSSSLLLLFIEERERRKSRAHQKGASTGWECCNKVCPQVAPPIHGFSVDYFLGRNVVWRGFAVFLRGDPRSTGGNACVPPWFWIFGGLHGA